MLSSPRATTFGLISVLIWGTFLPINRLLFEHLGIFTTLGAANLVAGIIGLTHQIRDGKGSDIRSAWRSKAFYVRWVCFCLHVVLVNVAVLIVSKSNFTVVILLNYFWPTAVLLCSIALGGVQLKKGFWFVIGTSLVLFSLGYELIGTEVHIGGIFDNTVDKSAYLLVFIGALSWGLYSALSRKSFEDSGGSAVIPVFQLTLSIVFFGSLFAGHLFPEQMVPFVANFWLLGPLLTGVSGYIAYLCWDAGMRFGNVVILSLFADFIPWLSLITAALLLGVTIHWTTVLSAVVLVIGAVTTRSSTKVL